MKKASWFIRNMRLELEDELERGDERREIIYSLVLQLFFFTRWGAHCVLLRLSPAAHL